ncbi:ABC transporter permease [Desulfosarcina ovata subsp. sediminis]|uniref:ABC transporter permease n=1 Tax=Desulfosarcina ovata subsp. sediminis TaxID=885957 RepID=A0A5K7ZKY3_9BACT|nr:iron ABC transporter permease [Desulfosarcina ovata]BBO80647.1 ABC transporter permease [Desulfosarcina ovata subsp. sediminis]
MIRRPISLPLKIAMVCMFLFLFLLGAMLAGISMGSSGSGLKAVWASLFQESGDTMQAAIIWRIRLPRVLLAALVGAALSLGGLVFQALLKNPLAEPYILGISGGAAIGAIVGIILGLSRIPGVGIMAFLGSLATLLLIILISSGRAIIVKDSLLLSGVMVNAFCSAVIMFLLSITQDARLHNIIFWLMGDLSASQIQHVVMLAAVLLPCFIIIFMHSNRMNLLLLGGDMATSMGVAVKRVTLVLLITTSLMVSVTVSQCGLIGFVGLVIPHLLRLIVGPDHRVLAPGCILGGGAYMVVCDLLARVLPAQGEMPGGVITAMIGAPLFIILLRRSRQ